MGNKFRDKVVEEDLEAPRPEPEPEVEVEETQRGGREGGREMAGWNGVEMGVGAWGGGGRVRRGGREGGGKTFQHLFGGADGLRIRRREAG